MVAISLLTLRPGRMGGSETYVRALTKALADGGSLDYVVAVRDHAADAAGGLPTVGHGVSVGRRRSRALPEAAMAWRALDGADLVHYPVTVPVPPARGPRVITLHDVVHRDLPDQISRRTRVFRLFAYDRAARRSQRVIVPSAFVRDRATLRLRLDPENVRVIHHGVDHAVFTPGAEEREPFLLYPARPWPHKNHALLFEAFGEVRRARPDLELILTGGGHETLELPLGVRSLGLVPLDELAALYRRAAAVVFPSRSEGFGMPALEAMASGCAVAAAAGTAVAEVAGDAAVLFAPDSATELVRAVLDAVDDRRALGARGLAVARRFTWERAACLHEEVYRELI